MARSGARERAAERLKQIFAWLCIALFALLLCLSLWETWENDITLAQEIPVQRPGAPLAVAAGIVLLLLAGEGICRLAERLFAGRGHMGRLLVCVLILLVSLCFAAAPGNRPAADQWECWQTAAAFNEGNYSATEPFGYVFPVPYQMGLITLMRVLCRLFGSENWRSFQYLNALCVPVMIWAGYGALRCVKAGRRAQVWYSLLMLTCVPLYLYVRFVYGEVVAVTLCLLGAWALLSFLERPVWYKGIGLVLCFGLAVQMRNNAIIFAVAAVIVAFVRGLGSGWKRPAAAAACVVGGVVLFQAGIDLLYAPWMERMGGGMPLVMGIAMGTNDAQRGWYNGAYSYDIYVQYEFSRRDTALRGLSICKQFLLHCLHDPAYMVSFYHDKLNSQWCAPMYQAIIMTDSFYGEQWPLTQWIYAGWLRPVLERWMDVYQSLLYGAVLLLLLRTRRSWPMERYILLLGVYGGFLFSILWEAKSRYSFPYLILLLPCAAIGCAMAGRWLARKAAASVRQLTGSSAPES